MNDALVSRLIDVGLTNTAALVLTKISIASAAALIAVVSNFVGKRFIIRVAERIAARTRTTWDDIIMKRRVLTRLSHIAPAIVVYFAAPAVFPDVVPLYEFLQRAAIAYMIAISVLVLDSVLDALVDIYNQFEQSNKRPIKGYMQLVKILVYIIGVVLVVTTLLNKSPVGILGGIGAMSAVLLLIFRDSILGLVSSLQLAANDMVRIGDWIEMPKYNANGDVIDITLQSIKVRNWDKTITTIPIYSLVSDSFKNWRGMLESGGRRIMRSLSIDMRSVQFATPEMLDRYERYQLIRDYVKTRREDVARHNEELHIKRDDLVSGRRLTNLGTFRAYVAAYLQAHPKINHDMTFLIRQLQPGPTGLPLEIYVFSADKAWANYETIQADIFDHLLAVMPEFGLRVYQEPSGWDLQLIAETLEEKRR